MSVWGLGLIMWLLMPRGEKVGGVYIEICFSLIVQLGKRVKGSLKDESREWGKNSMAGNNIENLNYR